MLRILDLDLDFFLHDVAYWAGDSGRLDAAEYPPWELSDAISFLEGRCLLGDRLPGFVVENHGELFQLWRRSIERGLVEAPFHVTHVDAHADLGLGDAGYMHLMTDLLYRRPEDRDEPKEGSEGLNDGNYLAFAIACRWLSELIYVCSDRGGNDLMTYHLESFDPSASRIQLKAMKKPEIEKLWGLRMGDAQVDSFEPPIPFARLRWNEFQADVPFDFICFAHSPTYTPPEADAIFDEIRQRFIDEVQA